MNTETFTLSGECDKCHETSEWLRPIRYGEYRCKGCYEKERRAFIERLLKEEQEQVIVDIITGKVLGKRKDIEG